MRKSIFIIFALALLIFVSCATNDKPAATATASTEKEGPDSMIYGLACDGTNDSVIVMLPFSGEDPKTYNIEYAKVNGMVIGQLQIGDWVGLKLNPADSTEATMVVDLDELKATWTYEVRPTWKDASKMSRRALKNKMSEIPDSLREAYLIPREYGFTLKRSSIASSVGRVHKTSSLEDDSPVEYPEVKNYTGWKCRNGRLILISTPLDQVGKSNAKLVHDTLDFVMLTADSLILRDKTGQMIHFHKVENAMDANARARDAANKASKATKNVVEKK